jgi:hypothetical protein
MIVSSAKKINWPKGSLFADFVYLLAHFSRSRIHLGVFRKRIAYLLADSAYLFARFGRSRIHLGVFRK